MSSSIQPNPSSDSSANAHLNVESNHTRRTTTRHPHPRLDIIPRRPIHLPPAPITRRTAHIPARLPALIPVDVLRELGIGRLDRLRVGQLVAVAPFLARGAGDGEAAGGGGAGGAYAVGDGLRVAFVAGDGAGVAAGGEGGGDGGGGGEGEEGEGGEGEGRGVHGDMSW